MRESLAPPPDVMIVDDDRSIREKFQKLMASEGLQCETEPDPWKVLEMVSLGHYPRVIVSDI